MWRVSAPWAGAGTGRALGIARQRGRARRYPRPPWVSVWRAGPGGGGVFPPSRGRPRLLVGVVQLAERVGDLDSADERLPALDHALLGAVRLRERRQLDRVVDDEGRLDQLRLDALREQPVDELAPTLTGAGLRIHRRGE